MKLPVHRRMGAAAEKRIAKQTGSRRQPASGALWSAKGDLKNTTQLIEVKATAARQYVLKLATLRKIEEEALSENRDPCFYIEFNTPQGRVTYRVQRYYGGTD